MDDDQRCWNVVFTRPWSSVYSGQGHSSHYSCYLPQEPATNCQPSPPQPDRPLSPQPRRESARSSHEQDAKYSYDVKIINPKKKSDFVVRRWHGVTKVFRAPAVLKVKLHEFFPNDVSASSNLQVGYLEGNHKRWIFEERDLSDVRFVIARF